MDISPAQDAFSQAYNAGANQVLWTELVADMDTAVSLMLKLTGAQPDSFMLESVTGGEIRGRYSVIGCKPDLIWRCHGTKAEINRQARYDRSTFVEEAADPLADPAVQARIRREAEKAAKRAAKDARKAADLLFILTVVFSFISLVVMGVAAVNILHTAIHLLYGIPLPNVFDPAKTGSETTRRRLAAAT